MNLVKTQPLFIAGPCSIESEQQFLQVVEALYQQGIDTIRAGVWKPRTRPNSFEGIGAPAFDWIKTAKAKFPVKVAIEVATPEHAALALENNIDMVWLGARTTVNPFHVQEIADALQGTKIPVMVKNPVNPDLALWVGAIERLKQAGIKDLVAIHRGFSTYQPAHYRNLPLWQIPIELKTEFPELPVICDPSHIAGKAELVAEVAQKAMDLYFDGLIVEVHPQPKKALSDAAQQLTPEAFARLKANLTYRKPKAEDLHLKDKLAGLRDRIDLVDTEIIDLMKRRLAIVEEIGSYKKAHNIAVFQLDRWDEIYHSRPDWAVAKGLDADFIRELYKVIHDESIRLQTEIYNRHNAENTTHDS